MKTTREIRRILESCTNVDVHVHTHLCDGLPEMTVENIANRAEANQIGAVVLTPHFHKQVADETEILYTDSDEEIFLALRDEINHYSKQGRVKILLSTEADILSVDGQLSIQPSSILERTLDLVTPTMNYNPILPLCMVHLTYGKDIKELHESGQYNEVAQSVGGISAVLEAMYEAEANALLHSPFPSMLGHFFAAHSIANKYSWFNIQKEHIPIMRAGVDKIIDVCKRKDCLVDITGIHEHQDTVAYRASLDGFLHEFQKEFIEKCRQNDIGVFPGSDAHRLTDLEKSLHYHKLFSL